jgi:hypothetical protein
VEVAQGTLLASQSSRCGHKIRRAYSKDLDRRVNAALDETRLLILEVQVLLGSAFQCFFQDGFSNLSEGSKSICIVSQCLVTLSTGVLVDPVDAAPAGGIGPLHQPPGAGHQCLCGYWTGPVDWRAWVFRPTS